MRATVSRNAQRRSVPAKIGPGFRNRQIFYQVINFYRRRYPLDTCVSCFLTLTMDSHRYARELGALGEYGN